MKDVRDINKAKNKKFLLSVENLPYLNTTKKSKIEIANQIMPWKTDVKNGIGKKSKNQLKIKFLKKLATIKTVGKEWVSICIFPFGVLRPFLYIIIAIKKKITKEKIPKKKSDFFLFNKNLDVYAKGKNKQVLFEKYAAIIEKYENLLFFLSDSIKASRMKNPIRRSFLCASQI